MVALGKVARHLSQALGGNGHRPGKGKKLILIPLSSTQISAAALKGEQLALWYELRSINYWGSGRLRVYSADTCPSVMPSSCDCPIKVIPEGMFITYMKAGRGKPTV